MKKKPMLFNCTLLSSSVAKIYIAQPNVFLISYRNLIFITPTL